MTKAEFLALIRRNPVSLGAALVSLLLGGAIFYRSSGLPETIQRLDEKSREGRRLAANLRNGSQLPEQLEQLKTAAKTIEQRLVRASELAQNLQYFYRLEADTGVKLLELRQNPSSGDAKQSGALGGVGFSVAVQGEYLAVIDLVRRLESGAHYCRVLASSISGSGADRTGPVRLSLELELLGQP